MRPEERALTARFALPGYEVAADDLLTPALLIYPAALDNNIAVTLKLLGDRPDRWRPHVKTAKLAWVMQRLLDHGIRQFKCANTRELATLLDLDAPDVLLAFPVVGANARLVRELAARYPASRVSVLVDHPAQIASWQGSNLALFLDVNSGMNRTGIAAAPAELLGLARAVRSAGLPIAGLHWYDGHLSAFAPAEQERVAHTGYTQLLELTTALQQAGITVPEVITSGTAAFPHALSFAGFSDAPFAHRVSPGTPVYGDLNALGSLPPDAGYRPAALVLASVVSRPGPQRITCDAGHKALAADAGHPICSVIGHSDWTPAKPSEEHLPIDLPPDTEAPAIGSRLYLLPRHVCPTVNHFSAAALVENGQVIGIEAVTARGHDLVIG